MKNSLSIDINHIKNIDHLTMTMPIDPDVYAITGINGIGKSTLLSCITPRLMRPVSFAALSKLSKNDSFIKYAIGDVEEIWTFKNGKWRCSCPPTLSLRGFQEGSLTNGTRFFQYICIWLSILPSITKREP